MTYTVSQFPISVAMMRAKLEPWLSFLSWSHIKHHIVCPQFALNLISFLFCLSASGDRLLTQFCLFWSLNHRLSSDILGTCRWETDRQLQCITSSLFFSRYLIYSYPKFRSLVIKGSTFQGAAIWCHWLLKGLKYRKDLWRNSRIFVRICESRQNHLVLFVFNSDKTSANTVQKLQVLVQLSHLWGFFQSKRFRNVRGRMSCLR